jgi:hypothetical protein
VARGFIETSHRPVRLRSSRKFGERGPSEMAHRDGFRAATPPNGDKSPRHNKSPPPQAARLLQMWRSMLEPARIPEGVIADFLYQSCPQRIGNDVASEWTKIFAITDCPVDSRFATEDHDGRSFCSRPGCIVPW